MFRMDEFELHKAIITYKSEVYHLKQICETKKLSNNQSIQKITQFKSKHDSRRNKLKVDESGLRFDVGRYMCLCVIISICLLTLDIINWILINQSVEVVMNTTNLYILGIENWNSMFTFASFSLVTITFNDTYKMWGSNSSLEISEYMSDYISNNIIDNFTALLHKDLGNITEEMRVLLDTGNYCQ